MNGGPSHLDIARELSEGIAAGRYPVGTVLPTEFELCARLGASRYSVRRALQQLQEQGLISRRRNAGTRVESVRPLAGYVQAIATVDELAQFGAKHVRTVQSVSTVRADSALAGVLGCDRGAAWLRISSLRMENGPGGLPIGWTDVYVEPAYAAVGEMVRDAPDTLISTFIEERFGRRIRRILQEIKATSVPRALAAALQVDAGSPALRIVRRYLDEDDRAFEVSVSIHPADRFTFSSVLTRGRAGPRAASDEAGPLATGRRAARAGPASAPGSGRRR